MHKKTGLKILLENPFAVVMAGIRAREQQYFQKKTQAAYHLDRLPTLDLLDLFPKLNVKISPYSFLSGTTSISDLVLLKSLAKRTGPCAYLEIGRWRGESLANMSDVSHDCTSVSFSINEMKSRHLDNEFIKVHGFFSDSIKTIHKIDHDSQTFNFSQLNQKFDLIFIDGDHSYEGILRDTQQTYPLLKNEQSTIVWHDYGFDPEKVRYSTLKAILDGIPEKEHKNLYHVSNTMCAIFMKNTNIPTTLTHFPSYPNKKFSITITAEKLS
ncbi:MAG: class I SAM-dependent methyltransferase [Candidatus Marinimicrobia bacterium]|nr:class I SAM-dependent methyltransferase [Candidatus Neomarinimicrobiota bacterium]